MRRLFGSKGLLKKSARERFPPRLQARVEHTFHLWKGRASAKRKEPMPTTQKKRKKDKSNLKRRKREGKRDLLRLLAGSGSLGGRSVRAGRGEELKHDVG